MPHRRAHSSADVSSASDSPRESGCRSSRRRCPSFQSAVTASGAGPPVRMVTITVAARRCTNCCSTNADKLSSKRASSTTTRTGAPSADAVIVAIRQPTSCSGLPSRWPAHCAKTPSGTDWAATVPATQCTAQPRSAAAAAASRANRVLPTPAEPAITTPAYASSAQSTPAMTLSSSARPVSGQACIRRC